MNMMRGDLFRGAGAFSSFGRQPAPARSLMLFRRGCARHAAGLAWRDTTC